jgi:hypothetical protein
MLELAVIRRNTSTGSIDVGRLLDVMLFYGKVHLVLDGAAFPQLLAELGVRNFGALLGHRNVTSEITAENTGVHGNMANGRRVYGTMFFMMGGRQGEPQPSTTDIFVDRVRRMPDLAHRPSRDAVQRLLHKGRKASYESILGGNVAPTANMFRSLASDQQSLRMAIDQIAAEGTWTIDRNKLNAAHFAGHTLDDGSITIDSNVPIEAIVTPTESNGDLWGTVLARLHDYAIDLVLSQTRSADLIVSPEVGDMATMRIDLSIQRGQRSSKSITQFEEFTLRRGGVLGAAYTAGLVSFDKALGIIDEAEKFRGWLNKLPPNADLIAEYHAAVTRGTVLETVAGRAIRYALITGGGLLAGLASAEAGVGATLGLGAFDTFVVDRIARGWRPNAFIDGLKRGLPQGDDD